MEMLISHCDGGESKFALAVFGLDLKDTNTVKSKRVTCSNSIQSNKRFCRELVMSRSREVFAQLPNHRVASLDHTIISHQTTPTPWALLQWWWFFLANTSLSTVRTKMFLFSAFPSELVHWLVTLAYFHSGSVDPYSSKTMTPHGMGCPLFSSKSHSPDRSVFFENILSKCIVQKCWFQRGPKLPWPKYYFNTKKINQHRSLLSFSFPPLFLVLPLPQKHGIS